MSVTDTFTVKLLVMTNDATGEETSHGLQLNKLRYDEVLGIEVGMEMSNLKRVLLLQAGANAVYMGFPIADEVLQQMHEWATGNDGIPSWEEFKKQMEDVKKSGGGAKPSPRTR